MLASGKLQALTCKLTRSAGYISCNWDFGDWGLGWSFAPDYYPTGETLFTTGSLANSSGYTDPKNDSMINQTLTNSNLQYL